MNLVRSTIISVIVFMSLTHAGGSVSGAKVTGVYCGYFTKAGSPNFQMCSVYFDKKITGSPTACPKTFSGESYYRFQFKMDDIGKGILAIALSANATGAQVQAYGLGSCSIWDDTEDLSSLFLVPPSYPSFP